MDYWMVLVFIGIYYQPVLSTSSKGPPPQDSSSMRLKLTTAILREAAHVGRFTLPVATDDSAVKVMFGLRIMKIEVDGVNEELTVTAWCRLKWQNEFLIWKESDYHNISHLVLPTKKMWIPDITLTNSAKNDKNEIVKGMVQLESDGSVYGAFHHVFRAPCLFTLREYPWDEYSCDMWFQSLAYGDEDLNIIPYHNKEANSFDLDTYLGGFKEMEEWEIVQNLTAVVNAPHDHQGSMLMFTNRKSLRMTLVLRRRVSFKVLLLTVPSVIFGFMTCLMFLVPPARPDRLAYGNSLFAAYMVFMLILAASMPHLSGALPKLGLFYGFNILMIVVSISLSVIVIHISRKGAAGEKLPRCLRKVLIKRLGPVLMVHHVPKVSIKAQKPQSSPTSTGARDDYHAFKLETIETIENMQMILNEIKCKLRPREHRQHNKDTADDWSALATILDRLFFIMSCIVISIGLALLFPWPQNQTSG